MWGFGVGLGEFFAHILAVLSTFDGFIFREFRGILLGIVVLFSNVFGEDAGSGFLGGWLPV